MEKRFRPGEVGERERVIGSPIGLAPSRKWPVTRRVTLVGDAAQAVDPLLGEGIHYALWSGQEAAAAVDRELTGQGAFPAEMSRRGEAIRKDLKTNWRVASHFYSHLDLGYSALRASPVRNGLLAGFAKGWTLSQAKNRFLVAPLMKGELPDYLRP